MDFEGAGVAHHADDLLRGGAAHQRVVDQDDALAFDRGAVRIVLHAHAEFANALGRLNESAADVMVSDDAEFERYAGMLAVADRGGDAGIRHRHHDVDLDMAFARELRAERFSDFIYRSPADDGIRPREIDVFEDAGPRRLGRKRFVALRTALVEHDDLAGLDVADVFRADDVERAGFRGQDRTAAEFAHDQRTDAERIARPDQLLVGQRYQRIGTLDRAERLDEAIDEAVALRLRDQMQDNFGVGGGLHHGAVAHEVTAQRQPVGEIAVVADRETAGIEFGKQRLHVAQDGGAGGRVADMADRGIAGQTIDDLAAGEGVADEAEPPLGMKSAPVEGDDARSLLAAMLQGVQLERGDGGGFGMTEDAEHPAFFAQRVPFQVNVLQVEIRRIQIAGKGVRIGLCGVVGRALHLVHRLSFSAEINVPRASQSAFSGCRGQVYDSQQRRPARPARRHSVHHLVYSS